MRRHLAGLFAALFVAAFSALVTTSVHTLLGAAPVRPAVRTFSWGEGTSDDIQTNLELPSCGFDASRCTMYRCSDGSRVFDAVYTYADAESARRAISALEAHACHATIARAEDGRSSGQQATWLIFRGDAIQGGATCPYVGDSSNATAWLDGNDLHVIFGPSHQHIADFAETHWGWSW